MQHPGDHEPVLMYDGADGFYCSTCGESVEKAEIEVAGEEAA